MTQIYKLKSRKSEGPDGVRSGFLKEHVYRCESVQCKLSLKIKLIPREPESRKGDTIFKPSGKIWGATEQYVSLEYSENYGSNNKIQN